MVRVSQPGARALLLPRLPLGERAPGDIPEGTYSHNLFTERGLDFVRRHRDEPFFLYMAYTVPHAQLEPPDDAPYSTRDWPQKEKNLAAMVTALDRDVGRLFDLLKEVGLDQDTIVFFTSDNGPHSEGGADAAFFQGSGPLRGIKRDLYEGGIRVPMIARWPGRIAAGQVSQVPWAFWDFLPTCAELACVPPPDGLDGVSVVRPLWEQPPGTATSTGSFTRGSSTRRSGCATGRASGGAKMGLSSSTT